MQVVQFTLLTNTCAYFRAPKQFRLSDYWIWGYESPLMSFQLTIKVGLCVLCTGTYVYVISSPAVAYNHF